jgi:hypothetical protein
MDWWVERTDKGACFCFEDLEAKTAFVSICQNFGLQHLDDPLWRNQVTPTQ